MRKRSGRRQKSALLLAIVCAAAVSVTGCGNEPEAKAQEEETEKLTICVNGDFEHFAKSVAEDWLKWEDGMEVEIVSIPTDATLAETRISNIRTQLMAGEGPDIFLMQCSVDTDNEEKPELFSNLGKTMYSQVFLPLDDYIENAEYMDPEGWNQTIMDVGKTGEGQVILPIAYTYRAYAFRTADLQQPESVPASWEEFVNTQEQAIWENMETTPPDTVLAYTFGELADCEQGKLLVSEETMQARVEEILAWQDSIRQSRKTMPEGSGISPVATGNADGEFWNQVTMASGEEETVFGLPNDAGGVTAYVTAFAAINRNTKYTEQAFALLDFICSDEVMCKTGFPTEDPVKRYGGGFAPPGMLGIPTHQAAAQSMFRNDTVRGLFEKVENSISHVRFYSNLDKEIYWMKYRCDGWDREDHSLPTAEERQEIVHETYEKMKMQMAE